MHIKFNQKGILCVFWKKKFPLPALRNNIFSQCSTNNTYFVVLCLTFVFNFIQPNPRLSHLPGLTPLLTMPRYSNLAQDVRGRVQESITSTANRVDAYIFSIFPNTYLAGFWKYYHPLWGILTYCVLFWLSSWNFIGLLDAFCKDALCIIHQ